MFIQLRVYCCMVLHLNDGACSAQQVRKRTPILAPGQQQPAAAKPVAAAAAAKPAAAPVRQTVAPPKVRTPVGKQQPASRGATSSTPKAAAAKANDGLGANSAEVHPWRRLIAKEARSSACGSTGLHSCIVQWHLLLSYQSFVRLLNAWGVPAAVCLERGGHRGRGGRFRE